MVEFTNHLPSHSSLPHSVILHFSLSVCPSHAPCLSASQPVVCLCVCLCLCLPHLPPFCLIHPSIRSVFVASQFLSLPAPAHPSRSGSTHDYVPLLVSRLISMAAAVAISGCISGSGCPLPRLGLLPLLRLDLIKCSALPPSWLLRSSANVFERTTNGR